MSIRHFIIAIGAAAASVAAPAAATDTSFRTINAKDGLADNQVRDITRDSYGYVWLSTINGLSRYDGYRLLNYLPMQSGGQGNDVAAVRETADSTLWMLSVRDLFTYDREKRAWQKDGARRLAQLGVEGTVTTFYVDDRRNLWVATETGLYHYDYARHWLQHYANYNRAAVGHIAARNGTTIVVTTDYKIYEASAKDSRLKLIGQAPTENHTRDSKVYIDSYMNLWMLNSHAQAGTQWLMSLKTRHWRQLHELQQMGNATVNAVAEDNDGRLWVGTGNDGIHVFDYQEEGNGGLRLRPLMRTEAFLPHTSHISTFYLDDNNTMWVGSAKLGVAYTDLNSPRFNHVSTGGYEDVSALLQDAKGNLWIGFDGSGLMRKAPTGAVTHYSAAGGMLPSDIVTALATDRDGSLLAGTYGNGIARIEGGSYTPLYPDEENLRYVKAMATDGHGNLWVATVDRGVVRITTDGRHVNYTTENSQLPSDGTLCLAYDRPTDLMYIGTSVGVAAFDCQKGDFIRKQWMDGLKGAYVSSLLTGCRGTLWIGSRNGLWVYRPKNDSIAHLTTEQGLAHNVVRALAKTTDRQRTRTGNGTAATGTDCVWASTDNGLTCITADLHCYPFHDSDGLHDIVFSNNAALTTADGTALLGSFTGYVSIASELTAQHYPRLHVEFTDFRINGESDDRFASNHTLNYDERLGISVSAMVPALTDKVRYLYRFKGEKNWQRVPGNTLFLVGLQAGTHVLQVRAELTGDRQRADASYQLSELPVRVRPPLWLSTPALLLYVLLVAAAAWLAYAAMRRRQRRELAIKQLEMNLEKYEMEEEKIRFFTNISHDLKTPLTLVIAPLEKIRQNNLPHSIRTELDVAWRNARQLYDLVLQLLDFRKLDVGMEKLNLRRGDVAAFVRQTIQGFAYYATPKQIRLQTQLPTAPVVINFDDNKIRRIITNLLSNAYKYNADNGTVTVTLDMEQADGARKLILTVADTGMGIADKQHVFERFVQEIHGQEQEGSGIGLHIVKQYVSMMGGHITVSDNVPKGTVFTVTLPVNEAADAFVEELADDDRRPSGDEAADEAAGTLITDKGVQTKATILVVDDNTDARLFLQRSLDDEYHVLVAANGKEALQVLARNDKVSIIVSDVMMPEMDGIQLFREIKGNIDYSHIPVILLTAKNSEESIVAGLEEGVADYITKPYSLAVLRLRIRKVLEWAQNVYHSVETGIEIKPSDITVSSLDEELISHVIACIEANMQNTNYSVVQLSSDVGMTRGHLYKKLMAITGKSPLEFIRIIKLKRGKSLMDQGRTNISEVADMVGFSPKQFTHYFKLMYDYTPSEYLRKREK